jgi:hypothetical protein
VAAAEWSSAWVDQAGSNSPEQMEAMQRRIYSAEFSRYLLAMILTPPPSVAVEYKYAGESDVEDVKADVIDVTGPDNFSVRVFFDKKSHIAAAAQLSWTKAAHHDDDTPGRLCSTRRRQEGREEAEKKMHAEAPAAPEEVDFYIRLTDHKKVGGSCCHTS